MEKVMKVAKRFVNERKEFFQNAERRIKRLIRNTKSILKDAEIYVFGSYVKKRHNVFTSDIDVLIVSKEIEGMSMLERARIIAKMREGIPGAYIFQIHLVTPEEFRIYKRFIDAIKRVA